MRALFHAMASDLAQRVLTLGKANQKRVLSRYLDRLALPSGARVLDFGCGTGLFAPVFLRRGLGYHGFDPAKDLLRYASLLYPRARFDAEPQSLVGPFRLILANCCFHHIPEDELSGILDALRNLLDPGGVLLVIDILAVPDDPSALHRWYMTLEKGQHVRSGDELKRIVSRCLRITATDRYRDNAFGVPSQRFPLGNDLMLLECRA
jgi:SAM-dependent methyltransferase